jgi:succinylglutamate desuccinylase
MGRVKNLEIRTGLDRRLVANHSLRVATLEGKYNRMDAAISALAKEQDERITTLEQSNEKMNDVLGRSLEKIEQALELTNRRAVDVETLQQQIKEINSRLTALTNKYLELRPGKLLCENKPGKLRKVTEKEYRKIVSDTAPVSTRNLLAVKKSGRPRKVNKL